MYHLRLNGTHCSLRCCHRMPSSLVVFITRLWLASSSWETTLFFSAQSPHIFFSQSGLICPEHNFHAKKGHDTANSKLWVFGNLMVEMLAPEIQCLRDLRWGFGHISPFPDEFGRACCPAGAAAMLMMFLDFFPCGLFLLDGFDLVFQVRVMFAHAYIRILWFLRVLQCLVRLWALLSDQFLVLRL